MRDGKRRVRAVIMAGGRGARMAVSAGPTPKPLVHVRGVPLVERNLCALLGAGLDDVAIAVPAAIPAVGAFARSRCVDVGRAAGANVEVFEEREPLGTIGAARILGSSDPDGVTLVVNADNLTALDLRAFLAAHARNGADVTVATHVERFDLPWARVELQGTRVVGYLEKPRLPITIASAVHAVTSRALAQMPSGRCDAPELVRRLLANGARIEAWPHEAPWIDVNDASAVAAAERLVAAYAGAFELWCDRPAAEVAGCLIVRDDQVLLERRPPSAKAYAGLWDTPGGTLEPGETAEVAAARELAEELGAGLRPELAPLTRFDDVDPTSGRVLRHHVFLTRLAGAPDAREGQRLAWMPRGEARKLPDLASPARRSLAALDDPAVRR